MAVTKVGEDQIDFVHEFCKAGRNASHGSMSHGSHIVIAPVVQVVVRVTSETLSNCLVAAWDHVGKLLDLRGIREWMQEDSGCISSDDIGEESQESQRGEGGKGRNRHTLHVWSPQVLSRGCAYGLHSSTAGA